MEYSDFIFILFDCFKVPFKRLFNSDSLKNIMVIRFQVYGQIFCKIFGNLIYKANHLQSLCLFEITHKLDKN